MTAQKIIEILSDWENYRVNTVGLHQGRLVHLPIAMIGGRKTIDPQGWFWQTILQATHQAAHMVNLVPSGETNIIPDGDIDTDYTKDET